MAGNTRQRPRTCVACREESFRRALIRVVRSPGGVVLLDERGKLPGRGAYLCARRECIERARKTGALSRALKAELPADLFERLEKYVDSGGAGYDGVRIRRELRSLLGLSRRSGTLHIGTDSVKSQCAKSPLLILTAADCSESVGAIAERRTGDAKHEHLRLPLSVEELSAALGAVNVQAIALPERNGLADRIKMLLKEGGIALEQNESVRTSQDTGQEQ
ncbi:MAG: DUF448 domain-containing protein [Synergistaceae bacterium]|jgi:predicted RNA-binding protein YlxR (DUF448 family)|nr:DUF448 domain-containing protein [Synergistaceae bacterium]